MSTSTVDLHKDPHGDHGAGHGHPDDPHHQHHFTTMEQQFDTSKIGMWLFLATEVLLFGGLFVGFGMMQARFPEQFKEAHEHLQRPLGSLNTVVLLISSFTMVMGVLAARTNQRKKLVFFMIITILCACIFLGVKYFEYSHKFEEGLLPGHFYKHHGDKIPLVTDANGNTPNGYATFFSLFHDDRPSRYPYPCRHRPAGLDRRPWKSRRVQQLLLHTGRPGWPLLALGRFDLDLSVPVVLPNPMSEDIQNPKKEAAIYARTLTALLILTAITVGASYINFGSGAVNVVVALTIATIKATLVALFFMHLLHDKPVNGIIAVAGFIFLGLFLMFTLLDFDSRQNYQPRNLPAPVVAPSVTPAATAPAPEHK